MICVTTWFRLKHSWALIPRYLTYRRMQRDLTRAPGLRRYAFLPQSPLACCTLSIWESEAARGTFTNVPRHVNAVRRAKHLCQDIWSAYWRLDAISEDASWWALAPELRGRDGMRRGAAGQICSWKEEV